MLKYLDNSADRQKAKKKAEIKKLLEEAYSYAANADTSNNAEPNPKIKRKLLAVLLEDFSILVEDQPLLIGPRIVFILTLLAQALI